MKRSKKIIFVLLLLLLIFMIIQKIKVTNSLSNEKIIISKPIEEVVVDDVVENLQSNDVVNEDVDEVKEDITYQKVVRKLSNDVSLKGIIPSSGNLIFDDNCNYYEIEVYENKISFQVLVNDSMSVVKGNEIRELVVGENKIEITIKAMDGTTRIILINVIRKEKVQGIVVPKEVIIDLDESVKLDYEIVPKIDNCLMEVVSSNPEVVSVDEDGSINGLAYGNSEITVCSDLVCAKTLVKVVQRQLVSTVYNVDRNKGIVISKIPNMERNDFMDNFENDNEFLNLDNDKVGTGNDIKLIIEEIEYDSLKICILGDLNGDGIVTTEDSEIMKKILLETEMYDDIVYIAADLDSDGIIGMVDSVLMKKYIAGEISSFD